MNLSINYRHEKMKSIKEVLESKLVLPIHLQNKLIKELNFQIQTLENRQKSSASPKKRLVTRRLHTLGNSPKPATYRRALSINQIKENECLRCKKFNFETQIILNCRLGQHMYHEKCLFDMLKDQYLDNCPSFQCCCGSKLCPEYVRGLGMKGADQLVSAFYESQVQQLAQKMNIKKCRNFRCNFFWSIGPLKSKTQLRQLKPASKDYCPLC